MRVAVLGAGGGTGRRVARDLSEHPGVARADYIDIEENSSHRVAAVAIPDVESALADVDVAVGCLGGDSLSELAVAEIAIEKGIPYLSDCEGAEALEALQSLDGKARASGVPVVAGLGFSPGLSNVLSSAGAESLDEVRRVEISWVVSAGGELGSLAFLRAVRALSGSVAIFDNGSWHMSSAGASPRRIYFPEPVAWRRVALCDGPEVLTLPKHLSAREVAVCGGVTERVLDRIARRVSEAPSLSRSALRERMMNSVRRSFPWMARLSGARQTWSAMRVDVEGSSGGTQRTVTFGVMDQFANLISAPLVVGTLMAARGEIKGAGVMAAEAVISPGEFLRGVAERGVRVARLQR